MLRVAGHIQKDLRASKFAQKWEDSYVIREAHNSDYFIISWPNFKDLTPTTQALLPLANLNIT